jgi:Uma2 family endonuclease
MSIASLPKLEKPIEYPESDGEPIAENTLQFDWIMTIKGGLEAVFASNPEVFVAGDLLWYPVEGSPKIRTAPDAMVVLGRPKGNRGSYLQWNEGGIAPQVVFEVVSPSSRERDLLTKSVFYERYGVDEYYVYDPDPEHLGLYGMIREGGALQRIEEMNGWVSPRLGVRFQMGADGLELYAPDGSRFLTYVELKERAAAAEAEATRSKDLVARLAAQLKALGVQPEE